MKAQYNQNGTGSSKPIEMLPHPHLALVSTRKSHTECLSVETFNELAERKRANGIIVETKSTGLKERLQAKYNILNVKVKRSAREDKTKLTEIDREPCNRGSGYCPATGPRYS